MEVYTVHRYLYQNNTFYLIFVYLSVCSKNLQVEIKFRKTASKILFKNSGQPLVLDNVVCRRHSIDIHKVLHI